MIRRLVAFTLLAALAGCAAHGVVSRLDTPATYRGAVYDEGRRGIRVALTLLEDSTYRWRQTRRQAGGLDTSRIESGTWALRGNAITLVSGPSTRRFELHGEEKLRAFAGNPGSELTRSRRPDPILQSSPIEKVRWRLTALDGQEVHPELHREAWFRLEEGRLTGTTGCNRMFGGYTLAGEDLRFTQVGSTKMACPNMGDDERRFTDALDATRRFAQRDDRLDLMDPAGRILATFIPVPDQD